MHKYVALLRGINVGGKNKIAMADLRQCLQSLGFSNVITYIQSGNIVLESDKTAQQIAINIETVLPKEFSLDSKLIKVLVLSSEQVRKVVDSKPPSFGAQPEKYHYDVIFLFDVPVIEVLAAFKPRPGVDTAWPGEQVIYCRRLSSERTKSRLNQIMSSPFYKLMTIRNWNTTIKLLEIIDR